MMIVHCFLVSKTSSEKIQSVLLLQSRQGEWFTINYNRKDPPFLSLGITPSHTDLLGSQCLLPEERRLSIPETGEKERNCLFKSYTDLE